MKKLVAPVLAVAGLSASLLVGATSVSWAQDAAPTCAEATSTAADALIARDKAKVPSDVEQQAGNTQAALDTARAKYFALGENLPEPTHEEGLRLADRLDDADVIANPELGLSVLDRSDAIVAILPLVAPRDAAAKNLADAQAALATAAADLDAAEDARDIACAEPPATTPTTTPTSEPPAGDDQDGNENPPANNDDNGAVNEDDGLNPGPIVPSFSDSVVTPVGGVETGGGSA